MVQSRTLLAALVLVLPVAGSVPGAASLPPAGPAAVVQEAALPGFSDAALGLHAPCEARLLELPRSDRWREHLRTITSEPHPTGSEANRRVARYLHETMAAAGLEVRDWAYDVYLPQLEGLVNHVEIVTPERRVLPNREEVLEEDPYTAHPDLLPGWNAFSGSGDVTAQVVYANFGRKEDFDELEAMGVDVAGKIVLARYGGNFRGFKVKFAEERGAVGVVMFNDPGFGGEPGYPEGRQMNASTIQRGSVLTLDWTGDPLTPFEPALPLDHPDTPERLDPSEVGLHTIPVLPIGYGAAGDLLALMTGEPAPAAWQGGFETPHRLTGGDALTVRVHVEQRLDFTRAVNVIGTLVGSEFPDEWIILGSHYDPWGFGAHDPNGGTATLLELAQVLGTLADEGCRPRRSILIAHWDAEEYGIIGSAEWVEHLHDELQAKAVAYINADAAVSGPNFSSAAAPSLKGPIAGAAARVPYPGTDGSVLDRWLAATGRTADDPAFGNLGGGSDHVGFYTHVGIPSAGVSLGGSNGIYHSNYDTFRFFERFSDPDFTWGPTLARVDGVLALRLANADLLPLDLPAYARDVVRHAGTLEAMAADRGLAGTSEPIRFDRLRGAAARAAEAAARWEEGRDRFVRAGRPDAAHVARVNGLLIRIEQAFLYPEGLQGGAWYRSLFASPDPFSGYASWMLPGLRYEIETGNPAALPAWEDRYVAALDELARRIDAATAALAAGTVPAPVPTQGDRP